MSGGKRALDVRRLALGTMVLEKTKEVLNVAVEAREVRHLVTREEWSSERSMEFPELAVRLQERRRSAVGVSLRAHDEATSGGDSR